MDRKIIFFINPISGTTKKLNLEKRIIEECGRRNVSFDILFTSKEGNYEFLREKIRSENFTDVVICGGDGSIAPIIAGTLNTSINIGIIPLGSGNGLAATAGIPKSLNKAFQNIFEGVATATDAFMVNNRLGCHLTGLGFDGKISYEFSLQRVRGVNTYIKQVIKHFFFEKFYQFQIECNGKIFSEEAFLISIANSNQFGNNFKIAPKASLNDGLLDVIIIKKNTRMAILLQMIRHILVGKVQKNFSGADSKSILYFQTKKITIKNPDNAPFQIDGDPAQTGKEFMIEILPAAFKLIQPV
ncbi:MAG: YegS/Rv2252/BmrU family lipid kinase [Ginsengibacter sp.]